MKKIKTQPLQSKLSQLAYRDTKNLFLHGRGIYEIDKIICHDDVELLDLHDNAISKLSNIKQFKQIKSINLSNNQIDDFYELFHLSSLHSTLNQLNLQQNNVVNNPLFTITILTLIPNLKFLNKQSVNNKFVYPLSKQMPYLSLALKQLLSNYCNLILLHQFSLKIKMNKQFQDSYDLKIPSTVDLQWFFTNILSQLLQEMLLDSHALKTKLLYDITVLQMEILKTIDIERACQELEKKQEIKMKQILEGIILQNNKTVSFSNEERDGYVEFLYTIIQKNQISTTVKEVNGYHLTLDRDRSIHYSAPRKLMQRSSSQQLRTVNKMVLSQSLSHMKESQNLGAIKSQPYITLNKIQRDKMLHNFQLENSLQQDQIQMIQLNNQALTMQIQRIQEEASKLKQHEMVIQEQAKLSQLLYLNEKALMESQVIHLSEQNYYLEVTLKDMVKQNQNNGLVSAENQYLQRKLDFIENRDRIVERILDKKNKYPQLITQKSFIIKSVGLHKKLRKFTQLRNNRLVSKSYYCLLLNYNQLQNVKIKIDTIHQSLSFIYFCQWKRNVKSIEQKKSMQNVWKFRQLSEIWNAMKDYHIFSLLKRNLQLSSMQMRQRNMAKKVLLGLQEHCINKQVNASMKARAEEFHAVNLFHKVLFALKKLKNQKNSPQFNGLLNKTRLVKKKNLPDLLFQRMIFRRLLSHHQNCKKKRLHKSLVVKQRKVKIFRSLQQIFTALKNRIQRKIKNLRMALYIKKMSSHGIKQRSFRTMIGLCFGLMRQRQLKQRQTLEDTNIQLDRNLQEQKITQKEKVQLCQRLESSTSEQIKLQKKAQQLEQIIKEQKIVMYNKLFYTRDDIQTRYSDAYKSLDEFTLMNKDQAQELGALRAQNEQVYFEKHELQNKFKRLNEQIQIHEHELLSNRRLQELKKYDYFSEEITSHIQNDSQLPHEISQEKDEFANYKTLDHQQLIKPDYQQMDDQRNSGGSQIQQRSQGEQRLWLKQNIKDRLLTLQQQIDSQET